MNISLQKGNTRYFTFQFILFCLIKIVSQKNVLFYNLLNVLCGFFQFYMFIFLFQGNFRREKTIPGSFQSSQKIATGWKCIVRQASCFCEGMVQSSSFTMQQPVDSKFNLGNLQGLSPFSSTIQLNRVLSLTTLHIFSIY